MADKLIFDFNQTVISSISIGSKNFGSDLTIDMIRHIILNNLLFYKKKFRDYPDVIIACDGPNSWRRRDFPYYKAMRRKNKGESPLDWKVIYEAIDSLEEELTNYFPYKVVRVDGAEGDDVIAVLVKHFHENPEDLTPPRIKIISSDKDFRQLQIFPGVSQYSSIQKVDVIENDPKRYLFEMILRGDSSDGVPNFLSSDSCFVDGIRQRPLRETRIEECWKTQDPTQFCSTEELSNFSRNKKMVDLVNDEIPEDIVSSILTAYENAPTPKKSSLLTYFTKYRLNNLTSELQNF